MYLIMNLRKNINEKASDKNIAMNMNIDMNKWLFGCVSEYKIFLIGSVINILYDFYYLCYFLRLQ